MSFGIRTRILLVTVTLAAPLPAQAQSIRGRVVMAEDSAALEGVEISLSSPVEGSVRRVYSDTLGGFWLTAENPGRYELSAHRLGLKPESFNLDLASEEVVEILIRMTQEAISMEPIVVAGRRRIREGSLDQFYDRMARMKLRGRGQFLTRTEIEESGASNVGVLLYELSGVHLEPTGVGSEHAIRLRRAGLSCTPKLFIDGLPQTYDKMPPLIDLEAVELYRGRFEPVEGYWPDDCGMLFIWRKEVWKDRR